MDEPATKKPLREPVAWLHTFWMEEGQFSQDVTFSPESPYGVPGEDHSECYKVVTEPLYRMTVAKIPRIRV